MSAENMDIAAFAKGVTSDSWLNEVCGLGKPHIQECLKVAGMYLENEMRKRVPFKTGHLEGSIHSDYSNLEKLEVSCGTNVEYAARQEIDETYTHPIKGQAHYAETSLDDAADLLGKLLVGTAGA
jgi:hypothetical protein